MRKPRIGYLSADDPFDRKAWSGTHYSILSQVQKHIGEVVVLGPYRPRTAIAIGKVIHKLSSLLTGKRYNYRHSALMAIVYGKYFSKRIAEEKPDLILAVSASCELSRIKTNVPVVSVNDATVFSSKGYYKMLSQLSRWSLRESERTERLALGKAAFVAFSSAWARDASVQVMPELLAKSAAIPFGPNFTIENEAPPGRDPGTPLTLLFVGVSWERKGGAIALDCLRSLIGAGVSAQLIVCGCTPPKGIGHTNMKVIPFLLKNDPAQLKELRDLYRSADFLVLPTRTEAFGVVFCEASAHGLPSLATNTGGVKDVVRHGVNGFLFDLNDPGHVYAEKIIELIQNKAAYRRLRVLCRDEFETRLNWESWIKNLSSQIRHLL